MLHRTLQRAAQPFVAGIAEQQRAVAAVQQVGVSAVSGVDLDEGGRAVPQRGPVELRPPAGRPLEGQCRHRQPGLLERGGDGTRGRPAVRGTEQDEHGGADERAHGHRQQHFGESGAPGNEDRDGDEEEPPIDAAAPRSRQPRLADGASRCRPGEHTGRREACRDQPEVVVQRFGDAAGDADGAVEEDEGAEAECPGEGEVEEPSPALSGDQRRRRPVAGTRMATTWAIVTASCRTVTGIRATTSATSSRSPSLVPSANSTNNDEDDRRHAPDDETDHVAGMAVVALAGREVVESAVHRQRLRRRGRRNAQRCPFHRHVVPSRATAATTRRTSTAPTSRPP